MKTKPTKRACVGCRNNFYNGNNDLGITECWSLRDAEWVQRRRVPINMAPPYYQKPEWVLRCRSEAGYAFISPTPLPGEPVLPKASRRRKSGGPA